MKTRLAAVVALCLFGAPAGAERLTAAPLVNPPWLASHLHAPGLLIVDVRDPDRPATTFAAGHIEGAVSAPFAKFGWQTPADGLPPSEILVPALGALGIADDTQVVLVADGMGDFDFGKATRAYWVLKALGPDAVTILGGGQLACLRREGRLSAVRRRCVLRSSRRIPVRPSP